jgi:hypothetical protein
MGRAPVARKYSAISKLTWLHGSPTAERSHGRLLRAMKSCPADKLDLARQQTDESYRMMRAEARNLFICMPTNLKGLIDLLLYMERNFSTASAGDHPHHRRRRHIARFRPAENGALVAAGDCQIRQDRHAALLRPMKWRRRLHRKRNRQRLANHRRRLARAVTNC